MGGLVAKIPVIGDALAGKQDPGVAAQQINTLSPQAQTASSNMIGKFDNMANQDFGQMASNQTQANMNAARQASADTGMKAQQMVAQRGLGGSSLGLSAILGGQQNLNDQLGQIQANQPMLQNQMTRENLQASGQGMQGMIGAQNQGQIYQQAQASKGRQGGLMGAVGGVIGGIYGGPMGASAGMGIGNALSQA